MEGGQAINLVVMLQLMPLDLLLSLLQLEKATMQTKNEFLEKYYVVCGECFYFLRLPDSETFFLDKKKDNLNLLGSPCCSYHLDLPQVAATFSMKWGFLPVAKNLTRMSKVHPVPGRPSTSKPTKWTQIVYIGYACHFVVHPFHCWIRLSCLLTSDQGMYWTISF